MLNASLRNTGLVLMGIAMLASAVMPSRAHATSVTFVFDCQSIVTSPSTCTPGGPYGTLTLSDSLVDANRVDMNLNLNPTFGDTLEKVYLNWAPSFLANHKFYLVDPSALPGPNPNNPFTAAQMLGTVSYSNGNQGLGNFGFDISTNHESNTPFVLQASLALYNELPSPNAPVDLEVSDFIATSGGIGTPSLYAGYRTHNALTGGLGEFWAGSTSDPAVPEPTSLLLLGTGLAGWAGYAARRRAAAKKAAAASLGT